MSTEPRPINSRYLQEAREAEARWARTGLDRFIRRQTAVLLESQRLANEEPEAGQFRRIQIPLVRRLLGQVPYYPESVYPEPVEKINWIKEGF